MRNLWIALAIAALCAGCTSRAELAAIDDGKCKSYGSQPGSAAYTGCRAQLDAARTQADATEAAAPVFVDNFQPRRIYTGR
jgi:hypothetical protein